MGLTYPIITPDSGGINEKYFMSFEANRLNAGSVETLLKTVGFTDITKYLSSVGEMVKLPIPENIEETLIHNYNLMSGAKEAMVKSALGGFGNAAVQTTVSTSQVSIDPNFRYVYQNSQPRTFTYNISFIPQSKAEYNTVKEIVMYFKRYSSPQKISPTHIINHFWTIRFVSSELNELTKFHKTYFVLTNVMVNYTGAGTAIFYEGGEPKQINMSLSFAEMKVIKSDEW
jgi:hypothetical protein